jgi:hypothetical protein
MASMLPDVFSALAIIQMAPLHIIAIQQNRPCVAAGSAILLLLMPSLWLMAAESICLTPDFKRLPLGGHMEVLEDAGAPNLHLTSLSPSALAEQIDQEQA